MPFFVQLSFQADWLCYQAISGEKRFTQLDQQEIPAKTWKAAFLPTLFTPVNSARIIQGKRLIILLKAWEGKAELHENFAYCVA